MAEAASEMPVDFRTSPELAYYKLGGEMDTCRIITGTWQLDGKHGYHPFFMCVRGRWILMMRIVSKRTGLERIDPTLTIHTPNTHTPTDNTPRDVKQAIFDMVRIDGTCLRCETPLVVCILPHHSSSAHLPPRDLSSQSSDGIFQHTTGYTTFDVAPFYGQVERWLGELRAKIEDPWERDAYKVFTKLAFPPLLPTDRIGRAEVEKEVDDCLARLRADRLDLLQLHWWDFDDPRYLDVLHHLAELKDKGTWSCGWVHRGRV